MSYSIKYTNTFKKDLVRCEKRGYDMDFAKKTIKLLAENGKLPESYQQHKLTGNYKGCWECHLKPDWLLVWKQDNENLILLFTNTGTHSDLFGQLFCP